MTKKEQLEWAMERITTIQKYIKDIEEICSFLSRTKVSYDFKVDTGNLRSTLISLELDSWRDACMWGLTVNEKLRERVKAAVYERFLREGMGVSHWLNPSKITPSGWFASDEEEFRKMVKEAFLKEKGEEDNE